MGSGQSSNREQRENSRRAATRSDVERALAEQRLMYEQRMRDLIQDNRTNSTTVQQPVENNSLERQRNPYNYTQSDLQRTNGQSNGNNLYPNLSTQGNNTPSRKHTNAVRVNANRSNITEVPGGFVYVNNVTHHSNEIYKPSAPPLEITTTKSKSKSEDEDVSCPICGNRYGERIFQCNMGHSACHVCKMRQVRCSTCRLQLTDRRNYELEKYVAERKVKCSNADGGCQLYFKLADMERHEKECPFKDMECPSLEACQWRGKPSQLSTHFDAVHPLQRLFDVDKEMFLSNICNENHTVYFVKIGNYNFLFHLKVSESERRIYMATQLIGTKTGAEKWSYEIHIYNKREPRRKFHYTDRCTSNKDPIVELIRNTKCAVIPQQYAMTFINEGSVVYKLYIKKDEVKKEPARRYGRGGKRIA